MTDFTVEELQLLLAILEKASFQGTETARKVVMLSDKIKKLWETPEVKKEDK